MLEDPENPAEVYCVVGNADIDYRLHFLPELRLHVIGGIDSAPGHAEVLLFPPTASKASDGGLDERAGPQINLNQVLTVYANYNKDFDAIMSTLDDRRLRLPVLEAQRSGYDTYNALGEYRSTSAPWDERHTLLSYYGRLNYTFMERYLLTATMRRDGSSRFAKDHRWGTFPSVALHGGISKENFFRALTPVLNDLKIRASYGVTGQQDGIANYSHLSNYTYSQPGASYYFAGQWIQTVRPSAYNSDLKWETTKSWNFGLDFGFMNNRITGSVDYYTRKTKDLLATVPVPAGVNFAKEMLTNVGNVDSKGVEIALNARIIDTKDFSWNATFNATWLENTITNLSLNGSSDVSDTYVGYAESTPVMVYKPGYTPHTLALQTNLRRRRHASRRSLRRPQRRRRGRQQRPLLLPQLASRLDIRLLDVLPLEETDALHVAPCADRQLPLRPGCRPAWAPPSASRGARAR